MKNLTVVRHPLVQRDISTLRDRRTSSQLFRATVRHLAAAMAHSVTADLGLRRGTVRSPLERTVRYSLADRVVLIPILRAGLGLVDGFLEVLPEAQVGHVGMYRDEETLRPVEYYFKIPSKVRVSRVFLLDPMLATGGSGSAAISFLKSKGARSIRFVCLIAAPEGVRRVVRAHPDVPIFTAALDRELDPRGFILPGLGDAGDRIFGTES
ncbi:MAG: uracil phosphoribosyltransferase [Bacteroidota bacterium]